MIHNCFFKKLVVFFQSLVFKKYVTLHRPMYLKIFFEEAHTRMPLISRKLSWANYLAVFAHFDSLE